MLKTWQDKENLFYLYQFREGSDYFNAPLVFYGCSEKMHSFSTDRNAFVGNYRDESNPKAIEDRLCGNETMFSGEPCFALHVRKSVKAGEALRLCWFLGISEDGLVAYDQAVANAQRMSALCRDLNWVDAQKQKLATTWKEYLDHTGCELPDKDLQRMINTWAPINCMTTARFSRAINVEAPGVRGYGFRDTTQDMIAMCAREPEMAKGMFKKLLSKQYAEGKAVHMFPLNPHELPQYETRCDSHLWLPMLLYGILADTGDYGLLEEKIPYLSPEDHRSEVGEGTVWEHMMAAMNFTETHLGSHGLPLTLKGDWNDIIGKFSEKKKGESVFAAAQYVIDLKLLAEIARHQGLPEAEKLEALAAKQRAAMEQHAYNGKWWYRCFDDNGEAIGDENSQFGKLWLNPQSWTVMAGVGSEAQNRSAMGHVYETLKTDTGLRLIYPGFKTYPEVTDPFTGYNPGNGENGAIFCHANGWAVIAQALLGDGDRAWEFYELLAPQKALERVGLDTYRAEPYAWASNIVGPENPKHGWANVTHITGTAAWMDIAANQFLLGIRPKLTGVELAPVMKSEWPEMTATRVYRGTRIHMTVRNPKGVSSGIAKITVDGVEYKDAFLPAESLRGKDAVQVEVTLG
jgi:cellobiose phosphorylase